MLYKEEPRPSRRGSSFFYLMFMLATSTNEKTIAVSVLSTLLDALSRQAPNSTIIDTRDILPALTPDFILQQKSGKGGAQYSKREDGRDVITLFTPTVIKPALFRDVLLARKSSFVHEFIHLLDFKDVDPSTVVVPGESEKEQFTHPAEVKAYLNQGVYTVEDTIENTPKRDFSRKFGRSFDSFAKVALSLFHPSFLKHATDEVKQQIVAALQSLYASNVKPVTDTPSLHELVFNNGKDSDWPIDGGGVAVFSPNDNYRVEGKTHDGVSHAIKHAAEFFPAQVTAILSKIKDEFANAAVAVKTDDGIGDITDPQKVSSYLEMNSTLTNTLDGINDKVRNNKPLTAIEKKGYAAALEIYHLYKTLADSIDDSSVDVDNAASTEEIQSLVVAGKPIKFSGTYRGHHHGYVFDPKTRGLLSFRDDGTANTLFKVTKNVGNYVLSQGSITNASVAAFLKQIR